VLTLAIPSYRNDGGDAARERMTVVRWLSFRACDIRRAHGFRYRLEIRIDLQGVPIFWETF